MQIQFCINAVLVVEEQKKKLKQTSSIKPKVGAEVEILLESQYVKEELPLPYVLYPGHYGAFIGFSSQLNGNVFFCSCSELAIDNYIALKSQSINSAEKQISRGLLSDLDFPSIIAEKSIQFQDSPKDCLKFKDKICHKCNLATPSVRAMHPMYGGKFKQFYGWYIKQQYFHLGIGDNSNFLENICPEDILELLKKNLEASKAANKERLRLTELVIGPKRNDIADDEITFWRNVKMEEAEDYKRLEKESTAVWLQLSNTIENIVRQEFGFRNVGDGWIGESILCKIVQRVFPTNQLLRHHKPKWLEGLELDIYLPEIELAFEYQGQQHYHPIKAWGGKKALEKVKERDKKKREICNERGLRLIVIDYTEPLTEKYIKSLVSEFVNN